MPDFKSLHMMGGLPLPTLGFLQGWKASLVYLPVAIPFALLTVIGGVNVTESARVGGDDFNTRQILLVEALATLLAGVCGGVVQSTPYIGQPAYKAMGSRSGYTFLTGLFIGLGGIIGFVSVIVTLIPNGILAPILIFVAIDITAQAYLACPPAHAQAVAFAHIPSLARVLAIKLGQYVPHDEYVKQLNSGKGLSELQVNLALGNGFILTAMLWGAFLAELTDRRLKKAALYILICAAFSFLGVIHSPYEDGSMYKTLALEGKPEMVRNLFTLAYTCLAALIYALSFTKESREEPTSHH
jgi:AGZA family xanthine/uracil permease-like MFS transporter